MAKIPKKKFSSSMKGKSSNAGGRRKLTVQPLNNRVLPLLILQNPTPPKYSSSPNFHEEDALATEGTFERDEFIGYMQQDESHFLTLDLHKKPASPSSQVD
jgi:hypothetical protein